MLSIDQLVAGILKLLTGDWSRAQFEDWFSIETWNTHESGDIRLIDLVFAVEATLSRYHFEHILEMELRSELAKHIDPFVGKPSIRATSALVPQNSLLSSPDARRKAPGSVPASESVVQLAVLSGT